MTTRRQAGISGLVAALTFGVGSAIWGLEMPSDGTPVNEVVAWYEDTADRIVIGGSLSLLAIAAFAFFAAAIRELLVEAGADRVLAMAAFAGASLGMAAGLGAESINLVAALRAQDGELTPELAQPLFEISQILGSTSSAVGLGLFAMALGAAVLRTPGVLPRWLAIDTVVLGAVLLTPLSHWGPLAGAVIVVLGTALGVALLRGGVSATSSAASAAPS